MYRNNVYIRGRWTLKRFTLPISTLDTKVVSGAGKMEQFSQLIIWKHLLSKDTLFLSGYSGKFWFSKSQKQLFMLLGFWDSLLITYIQEQG